MKKICSILFLVVLLVVFTCANAAVPENGIQGNSASRFQGDIQARNHSNIVTKINTRLADKTEQRIRRQSKIRKDTDNIEEIPTFRLPSSLQIIEDEAFEGTAIVSVEIPETVESIGNRAFANIPTLHSVRISPNTKHIAKTAFADSDQVVLTGTSNSYARTWANENGFPFVPIAVITANNQTTQITVTYRQSDDLFRLNQVDSCDEDEKSPTEYAVGEFKCIWCIEGIAYHILGRSPPACV